MHCINNGELVITVIGYPIFTPAKHTGATYYFNFSHAML